MERETIADIRKARFAKEAQKARALADLALKEVDDALAEQSKLYKDWAGPKDGIPILDDDTLASPIGYCSGPESIIG